MDNCPKCALNILRETVMGRELFDYGFKTYANRWKFKHPTPEDFFRTMEDASAVDLDWFWRAWFFDIQPVDISMDSVLAYRAYSPSEMPVKLDSMKRNSSGRGLGMGNGKGRNGLSTTPTTEFQHVSKLRNKASGMQFAVDRDTSLRDFYYYYNPATDTFGNAAKVALAAQGQPKQESVVRDLYKDYTLLSPQEMKAYENAYLYEITFSNKGGFVMPIILQWNYTDGTSEVDYIHAYIWRKNEQKVTKNFLKHKEVASIVLDPFKETADIDESNHH